MKKNLLVFICGLLIISALPTANVFAESEAGTAAKLTFREAIVDDRPQRLREFLASYNSPLADEADTFVREADKNNLDWRLVAAISGVESTFGKAIPTDSYNAWGWGVFTGSQDGVHFKNWADGIAQVSEGLRNNYYNHGASTIYDVGWMYAANGDSWGNHTQYFIDQLDAFQPSGVAQLPVSI
jgi:hypothetical protein